MIGKSPVCLINPKWYAADENTPDWLQNTSTMNPTAMCGRMSGGLVNNRILLQCIRQLPHTIGNNKPPHSPPKQQKQKLPMKTGLRTPEHAFEPIPHTHPRLRPHTQTAAKVRTTEQSPSTNHRQTTKQPAQSAAKPKKKKGKKKRYWKKIFKKYSFPNVSFSKNLCSS